MFTLKQGPFNPSTNETRPLSAADPLPLAANADNPWPRCCIELIMPTRLVSGDTLVYYDADGRYETYGAPVRITEEQEEGCRETTGRSLIFFLTEDAISVDGQSEVRTEAATVTCPSFAR